MIEFIKNMKESLGSFFVLALVGVTITVFVILFDFFNGIKSNVQQKVNSAQDHYYATYENGYFSGEGVIQTIENAEIPQHGTKLLITVITNDNSGSTTTTTNYGYDDDGDISYEGYTMTSADRTTDGYITPSNTFTSQTIETKNVVTSIVFTEVN